MFWQKFFFFTIIINISQNGTVKSNFSPAFESQFFSSGYASGPINIATKDTKFIKLSPLCFKAAFSEKWLLNNTGQSIEVYHHQPTAGIVTGGILFNNIYRYNHFKFYWHNNYTSKGNYAYSTVDGKDGTQLEVLIYYYNTKYNTFENALNYRDGLIAVSSRINVGCTSPNPLYFQFQQVFKKVKQAGKSLLIDSAISYVWFANYPCDAVYYAYHGSYTDELSGKTYNSVTTIVLDLVPLNFITYEQFKDTFGSLLDCSGRPLINAVKQHPQRLVPLPIIKSRGLELKDIFI